MKIAVNAWTFAPNWSIPQGMRAAKRAGFDGVELNISLDGYLTPDMTESEVVGVRSIAEKMSLDLMTVSSGLWWDYCLTSPDTAVAERAMEIVRRGLVITRLLGGRVLLVVPGIVKPDVPYDAAYERSMAALKVLARDAEREGVIIGIENVPNKFLLSPLETRDFIDSIGSPSVQAYLDVGNLLSFAYPEQWVRILGKRIAAVHVKDFSVTEGTSNGFGNPLSGDLDWMAVRDALHEVGYCGAVTAEIPGYKILPDLGLRHAGESLKRVFKGAGRANAECSTRASE